VAKASNEVAPIASPDGQTDVNNLIGQPEPNKPAPRAPITDVIRWGSVLPLATGVISNLVREIETFTLPAILANKVMKNLSVRCIDPLIPEKVKMTASRTGRQNRIKEWLDKQEKSSVAFNSFETVVSPVPEQLAEVGRTLLGLGKLFIFSLPVNQWLHLPCELRVHADEDPEGPFQMVHWAPQKLVLSHPASGVFVSHCGWNSAIESLFCGEPVLGWPLFGDQLLNAKLLVRCEVGDLIEGTRMIGKRIVPAHEIVERIIKVAGWDGGSRIYQIALVVWQKRVSATVKLSGSSHQDFESLLDFHH
jgi:coniferyl-alcohol glucosyltransferase